MRERASLAARLFAASVAIGLLSAVLQAFVSIAVSGAIARFAALSSSELGQAALGQAALSTLLAAAVLLLAALAGLAGEFPVAVGAVGGGIAALLPALVIALGEGLDALGPPQLALVRGAGFLAAIAAGAIGLLLGRRLVHR